MNVNKNNPNVVAMLFNRIFAAAEDGQLMGTLAATLHRPVSGLKTSSLGQSFHRDEPIKNILSKILD